MGLDKILFLNQDSVGLESNSVVLELDSVALESHHADTKCYRAILGVKHLFSVAKPLCFNLKSSLGLGPLSFYSFGC